MKFLFPIIGLILGILIGINTSFTFPQSYSDYITIGILCCIDCVFNGIKSNIVDNFDFRIFIFEFLGNLIIAMIFMWFGNRLNINLEIVVIIIYGTRLFKNFTDIGINLLNKNLNKQIKLKKDKK